MYHLYLHYNINFGKTQDKFYKKIKNFGFPIDFGKRKCYYNVGGDEMPLAKNQPYDYSELLGRIKAKRITQEELAKQIHLNPSTLNQKLNNKSEFSQSEMRSILEILEEPIDNVSSYFFTR